MDKKVFLNKSLVSILDYNREDYLTIMEVAKEFEANPVRNLLQGKVVATLFFEPSTRTRLSFESAVTNWEDV
jgi:aspartate carbamoyltransferase catalytic subunit